MKNCNESEMQIQSILAVENIETLAPEISKKPKLFFSYTDICIVDYTAGCNAKALHGFDCVDRFLDLLVII